MELQHYILTFTFLLSTTSEWFTVGLDNVANPLYLLYIGLDAHMSMSQCQRVQQRATNIFIGEKSRIS